MVQPRPEYPRPNLRRSRWSNLNGEWEFGTGEKASFDRRIIVPFCPESELSGIAELPGDVVWYRRRFDAPAGGLLVLPVGGVHAPGTRGVQAVEGARRQGRSAPPTADPTAPPRGPHNPPR